MVLIEEENPTSMDLDEDVNNDVNNDANNDDVNDVTMTTPYLFEQFRDTSLPDYENKLIAFFESYIINEDYTDAYFLFFLEAFANLKSQHSLTTPIIRAYLQQLPRTLERVADINRLVAVCSHVRRNYLFNELPDDDVYGPVVGLIIEVAARCNVLGTVAYNREVANEVGELIKRMTEEKEGLLSTVLQLIFEKISASISFKSVNIPDFIYLCAIISKLIDEKLLAIVESVFRSTTYTDAQLINALCCMTDWSLFFPVILSEKVLFTAYRTLLKAGRNNLLTTVGHLKIKKVVSLFFVNKTRPYTFAIFNILCFNNLKEPIIHLCFDQVLRFFMNETSDGHTNGQKIALQLIGIIKNIIKNSSHACNVRYENLIKIYEPRLEFKIRVVSGHQEFVGLQNLGNTCYMNAVIQSLYLITSFRNDILEANLNWMTLTSKIQRLFACLYLSKKKSVAPKELISCRPNYFNSGQQQDCCEFLRFLLGKIEEETSKDFISKHFFGSMTSMTTCLRCRNQSSTTEPFLELTIPMLKDDRTLEHPINLLEKLADQLKMETLSETSQYHCDNCNLLTNAEKLLLLKNIPSTLVFTLMRFTYTDRGNQKLFTPVTFPLSFAIKSDDRRVVYGLVSVIVHRGTTMDSGHYFCLARKPKGASRVHGQAPAAQGVDRVYFDEGGLTIESLEGDLFADEWFELNDEKVSELQSRTFLSASTGVMLRDKATPYVAFYTILGEGDDTPELLPVLRKGVLLMDMQTLQDEVSKPPGDSLSVNASPQWMMESNRGDANRGLNDADDAVDDEELRKKMDSNFREGPSYIS